MIYKETKLKNNKSVLVDESAEIKEGDWYVDDTNQIRQSITSDKYYWSQRLNYYKVIATINHSISLDVPMVIVGTDNLI